MFLTYLDIKQLRNLTSVAFQPNPTCNIFYGNNGSGKTSLLEAIYCLSLARSFRTRLHSRVIQHGKEHFTVFGKLQNKERSISLGIQRTMTGKPIIHIETKPTTSVSALTQMLPIQLINHQSHNMLITPKFRRQFMNWGVFHVEHQFLTIWQNYQQALKQRNALIRHDAHLVDHSQISTWNKRLCEEADKLHCMRLKYIEQFKTVFFDIWKQLMGGAISLTYSRGWPSDKTLIETLENSYNADRKVGYTQSGPQRADIHLRLDGTPVQDVLSQGQQKLLIYCLKLAQGVLLRQQAQKNCLYLIDDLPAELDAQKRSLIAQQLFQLGAQIFITGVSPEDLTSFSQHPDSQMFHVKHGEIKTPAVGRP